MADVRWSGWAIDEPAALLILLRKLGVPLLHPVVVCDHITLSYPGSVMPYPETTAIVGWAADDRIQALVAEVNGSRIRPDGETFHVTLSRVGDAADWESKGMLRRSRIRRISPVFRVATTPILREAGRG